MKNIQCIVISYIQFCHAAKYHTSAMFIYSHITVSSSLLIFGFNLNKDQYQTATCLIKYKKYVDVENIVNYRVVEVNHIDKKIILGSFK